MPDGTGSLARAVLAGAALAVLPSPGGAAPEVQGPAEDRPAASSTAPLRDIKSVIADMHADAPAVRLQAVRDLRAAPYRDARAFRALAAAMNQDLNNMVRQTAAMALLDFEETQALAEIEAFLKNERGEEVRRSVCAALAVAPAHGNDPGATAALVARLAEDESAAVRLAAIAGLTARQDTAALGDLKRASEKDADPKVRAAALAAHKKLSSPPKLKAPKPKPIEKAPYGAVKGKDYCPLGSGWCECSRPPLKVKPRCVRREACEHVYFNSYQHQGFSCSWNGELIE